jgi:hypothetical protein
MWAVELTGRNSVSPSTMPCRIEESKSFMAKIKFGESGKLGL